MSDYNEPKMRPCDQDGCIIPATHTLVWTKQQYYCPVHLQKALGIAQFMGFPTPNNTVRELTIDERILNDEITDDA